MPFDSVDLGNNWDPERQIPIDYTSVERMPLIIQNAFRKGINTNLDLPAAPRNAKPIEDPQTLQELKTNLDLIKPSIASEIRGRILGFFAGIAGFVLGAIAATLLATLTMGSIDKKTVKGIVKDATLGLAQAALSFTREMSVQSQQMAAIKRFYLKQLEPTFGEFDPAKHQSIKEIERGIKQLQAEEIRKHYPSALETYEFLLKEMNTIFPEEHIPEKPEYAHKKIEHPIREVTAPQLPGQEEPDRVRLKGKRRAQEAMQKLQSKFIGKPFTKYDLGKTGGLSRDKFQNKLDALSRRDLQIFEKNIKALTKEFTHLKENQKLLVQFLATLSR
jgi:hypothetical protein